MNDLETRIASIIETSLARHGVDLAKAEGTRDDAEMILALMQPIAPKSPADELPEGVHMITDKDGKTRKAFMTQREYDEWKTGSVTTSYADLTIVPKRDFGSTPCYDAKLRGHFAEGWVVVHASGAYKGANALPGATWAKTRKGARQMIDVYKAVGGGRAGQTDSRGFLIKDDEPEIGQRFWHLLRAINGSEND